MKKHFTFLMIFTFIFITQIFAQFSGGSYDGYSRAVATPETIATFTISGTISFSGSPLSGVSISCPGANSITPVITDATGNYSFTVNAGGNYIIIPNKANYTFAPSSLSFNNIVTDIVHQNFIAFEQQPPTVITWPAISITSYSAIINGKVNPNNMMTAIWFEWGTSTDTSTFNKTSIQNIGNDSVFKNVSYTLTGLNLNSTYFFRIASQNGAGVQKGNILSFHTESIKPTVMTFPAYTLNYSTAILNGKVNTNNSNTIFWFEWGTTADTFLLIKTSLQNVSKDTALKDVAAKLTGLYPNTLYYFRAAAMNDGGTSKGNLLNFLTDSIKPFVTTINATNITSSSAKINGKVNPNNTFTTVWFEWGNSLDTSTFNKTTMQNIGNDSTFKDTSFILSGLNPMTIYYFRIAAKNGVGTQEGNILQFKTDSLKPIVITSAPTNVSCSTATLNGAVNSNNVPASVWFEWGKSPDSTTFRTTTIQNIIKDTVLKTTTFNLTGLNPNTIYYYRIVAKNTVGTAKGNIISFKTDSIKPEVVTLPSTNVSSFSAKLNGKVNPNNSTTKAWFEWGTSSDTISFKKTTLQNLGKDSVFKDVYSIMTGLIPNTKYYFRMAAENGVGTQKGDVLSFKTDSLKPDVTTNPAIEITANTAVISGKINPNNLYTSGWFEWGISVDTSNFTKSLQQNIGNDVNYTDFSFILTNLNPNTFYFFRAAAKNNAGTNWGTILNFKTSLIKPFVSTISPSIVTVSGARINASINANGSGTSAWFQYGLDSSFRMFNITNNKNIGSDVKIINISEDLSGLMPNRTYFYRIVAQNLAGTEFGNLMEFTTGGKSPDIGVSQSSNIGPDSVIITAYVNPNKLLTTVYFEYGVDSNLLSFQTTSPRTLSPDSNYNAVNITIKGIKIRTTYYFRVVANNASGISKGYFYHFITAGTKPKVNTGSAVNKSTYVSLSANINPNGLDTKAWFEVDTVNNYSIPKFTIIQSIGSGIVFVSISENLNDLKPKKLYYFRTIGENSAGRDTGLTYSFITMGSPPVCSTKNATEISTDEAFLNGSVNPNNSFTFIHFEYSSDSTFNNILLTEQLSVGMGENEINVKINIKSLQPKTNYYYRIVTSNMYGEIKGNKMSFNTLGDNPFVMTGLSSIPTASECILNAQVNPNGLNTKAWFDWGNDSTSGIFNTTTEQNISSSFSPKNIKDSLSGLNPNTSYFYRIVARNDLGQSKGIYLNFITQQIPPKVTTKPAEVKSQDDITLNGSINPNNSESTVWFEYSKDIYLNLFFKTSSQKILPVLVPVDVSCKLSGLSPNTNYYYRVSGINPAGEHKGEILSFNVPVILPFVKTQEESNVTSTSAVISGTVNANNSETIVTFKYGNDTNYGKSKNGNPYTISGIADTKITANLSDLLPNKLYHYRIKAQNSAGTSIGMDRSFITKPVLAEIKTLPASDTTTISAVIRGVVNPNNSKTTVWFEWGTNPAMNQYDSTTKQNIDSIRTNVEINDSLKNLKYNTKYYYRIVARNSAGLIRGEIKVFSTIDIIVIPNLILSDTNLRVVTGNPVKLTFYLSKPKLPMSVLLFYRKGGDPVFQNIDIKDFDSEKIFITFPAELITCRGLDYFIRCVWDIGVRTFPDSNYLDTPRRLPIEIPNISCEYGLKTKKYSMLSIPIRCHNENLANNMVDNMLINCIRKCLGEYDRNLWRILSWINGKYEELLENSPIDLSPGRGFWCISKEEKTLDFDNCEITPTNETFKIVLKSGWNQIGNPFLFDIDLSNIRSPEGKKVEKDIIHEWDGDYIKQNKKMRSWKGFFIKNQEDHNVTIEISPRVSSLELNKVDKQYSKNEWKLQIRITKNYAELGCLKESKDEWDKNDLSEPPLAPDEEGVRLRIRHDDWKECNGTYVIDYRDITNGGKSWNVELERLGNETTIAKDYSLEICYEGFISDKQQLVMYDYDNNHDIKLDKSGSQRLIVKFPAGLKTKRYRILAGESEYIEHDKINRITEYKLFQNYPNPFNPSTKIEYSLAENGYVRLVIYNVYGQQVANIRNEEQPKGSHFCEWEPKHNSSGIYYYKIMVYGENMTVLKYYDIKKLIFLK